MISQQLAEIRKIYSDAEYAIKRYERIALEDQVAAINELRYAGHHVLEASQAEDESEIEDHIASARNHCRRAVNDAKDAAIASYCVAEPKTPLRLSEKRNLFKLFSNDVGLLAAMYMDGIQLRILNGDRALNIGAVYENAVAQELKAHGVKPNYFNSKKQGELDFVFECDGRVVPVEVKSGKDYKRHSALDKVLADGNYKIARAYVLGNDNVSAEGPIVYAPVYASMFIRSRTLPAKCIYPLP